MFDPSHGAGSDFQRTRFCPARCHSPSAAAVPQSPRLASSTSRPPLWARTRGSATSRPAEEIRPEAPGTGRPEQGSGGVAEEVQRPGRQAERRSSRRSDEADRLQEEALQRNYEDANTDIQAQQNEIANRIGQKLVEVLDKYAKDNGFTVILDVSGQQSPVLWAASSVDITQAGGGCLQCPVGRSRAAQEGGGCRRQACGGCQEVGLAGRWNPRPPTRWAAFLCCEEFLALWKSGANLCRNGL